MATSGKKAKPAAATPGAVAGEDQPQNGGANEAASNVPGVSDADAAIEAAQSGMARKIAKPHPVVAPSNVYGDPQRPADAPVNGRPNVSHAEATARVQAPRQIAELRQTYTEIQNQTAVLQGQLNAIKDDGAIDGEDPDIAAGKAEFKRSVEEQLTELRQRGNACMRKIGELSQVPKLTRSVLTEQGWVFPDNPEPPKVAR